MIQLIQSSLMISCDNAHALHPNFRDKHDERHGPAINGGPVIKVNASQRYATNSVTGALFRDVCREADVPVQSFVTRADMGCGSTIGRLPPRKWACRPSTSGCPSGRCTRFVKRPVREMWIT